ncbi:DEKNAAC100607 [Brettanomyces naardenensis]|uniref:DEKNAAC100607 n=1 Tax=Brettanomyces naardenensis TaxID=13370 RepID=A0A448YG20_BRENA|nr:DEKNAAC100607 [Brettanomyces naardenensis]
MPAEDEDITNLDQDLKASRLAKYQNTQLIQEVKDWLYNVLGNAIDRSQLERDDLVDFLKDGSVLCSLVNTVWGDGALKYKRSKMAFVQMENIEKFLNFIRAKGVAQDELFQTVDLYEAKDPYQVVMTLQALSRVINKTFSKYPLIGPTISKKHERPRVPPKPKDLQVDSWSTIEYGYVKGSNQATERVVFGSRRDITGRK